MFYVKVIEKHFTYRKENQSFHDCNFKDPKEMNELVKSKKSRVNIWSISKEKRCIRKNLKNMRRSYCAITDLKKDQIIKTKDLILLRHAYGFQSDELKNIVGRSLKRNIKIGAVIKNRC